MKELTINEYTVVIFDGAEFGQNDGFYYQIANPGSSEFGVDSGPYSSEAEAEKAAREQIEARAE